MGFFIRHLFLILILCIICPPVFASERIIFYTTAERKTPEMDAAKRYLEKKGLKVSIYPGANSLETHIENINKMNKEKARALIVLNIEITEGEGCFVAVSNAKKTSGIFQVIDDLPGVYMEKSRELASSIASSFNVKVKELPLFPLIGADMPGIFVYIMTKKDGINIALERLYVGIDNYLKRGK
ncbi:MAG TPA: hypothetical protein PLM23_08505 [Syntrophorhabdaceae bacterium]|nr:hypothetical protein [Syntrophorhabdaceae bacterium]HPP42542.1 hypothetical protein [Syntrophorhabdaceae bacterium]